MKANKTKLALKQLFKQLDLESKGYIRLEAFKLLLETHNVRLAPKTIK